MSWSLSSWTNSTNLEYIDLSNNTASSLSNFSQLPSGIKYAYLGQSGITGIPVSGKLWSWKGFSCRVVCCMVEAREFPSQAPPPYSVSCLSCMAIPVVV
jgi:Leucine-rich repeat (LRR) protein